MNVNKLRDPLAAAVAPGTSSTPGMALDLFQAWCDEWDEVTFESKVDYFLTSFYNLPVLNAAAMRVGYVLLGRAGSGSSLVILGPLDWPTV